MKKSVLQYRQSNCPMRDILVTGLAADFNVFEVLNRLFQKCKNKEQFSGTIIYTDSVLTKTTTITSFCGYLPRYH